MLFICCFYSCCFSFSSFFFCRTSFSYFAWGESFTLNNSKFQIYDLQIKSLQSNTYLSMISNKRHLLPSFITESSIWSTLRKLSPSKNPPRSNLSESQWKRVSFFKCCSFSRGSDSERGGSEPRTEDSVESSRRTVLRPVLRDRVFIGGARVARVPTVIQELIHN